MTKNDANTALKNADNEQNELQRAHLEAKDTVQTHDDYIDKINKAVDKVMAQNNPTQVQHSNLDRKLMVRKRDVDIGKAKATDSY